MQGMVTHIPLKLPLGTRVRNVKAIPTYIARFCLKKDKAGHITNPRQF